MEISVDGSFGWTIPKMSLCIGFLGKDKGKISNFIRNMRLFQFISSGENNRGNGIRNINLLGFTFETPEGPPCIMHMQRSVIPSDSAKSFIRVQGILCNQNAPSSSGPILLLSTTWTQGRRDIESRGLGFQQNNGTMMG